MSYLGSSQAQLLQTQRNSSILVQVLLRVDRRTGRAPVARTSPVVHLVHVDRLFHDRRMPRVKVLVLVKILLTAGQVLAFHHSSVVARNVVLGRLLLLDRGEDGLPHLGDVVVTLDAVQLVFLFLLLLVVLFLPRSVVRWYVVVKVLIDVNIILTPWPGRKALLRLFQKIFQMVTSGSRKPLVAQCVVGSLAPALVVGCFRNPRSRRKALPLHLPRHNNQPRW